MATTLANALRSRRKTLGLTQSSIASVLGVSRSAVGQWEAGTHEPSTDNLISVCALLGMNVDDAIRGKIENVLPSGPNYVELSATRDILPADIYEIVRGIHRNSHVENSNLTEKILFRMSSVDVSGSFLIMFMVPEIHVPCPRNLWGVKGVYSTNVCGDYLDPKYRQGDQIFANSFVRPQEGDFSIVKTEFSMTKNENKNSQNGTKYAAYALGRYLSQNDNWVEIEVFKPWHKKRIALNMHTTVDRVYDPRELIAF